MFDICARRAVTSRYTSGEKEWTKDGYLRGIRVEIEILRDKCKAINQ